MHKEKQTFTQQDLLDDTQLIPKHRDALSRALSLASASEGDGQSV
ncbi:hypothetical protein [Tumebacillus permanentifrigoris]|uniref:Uncharacterized protein n=1 Tax=Tumebacillus permanentifrigoris TaxID=378543 RepID=A0A316D4D4_9BACL|nr:hypothetical protein [Tumebacillus permanentifrigoris]PWK05087.1 hypothetical protein C7459_12719 [Tumebacillus permanentifrigoris]